MTFTSLIPRTVFLACSGVVFFVLTYVVASTPTRVASRLGTRGLKRRQALEKSPAWAAIEPLVRWLGVRISGLVPEALHVRLDHHLLRAGDYLGLSPEEYVALSCLTAVGGLVFGVYASSVGQMDLGACMIVGALFGAAGPHLHISEEAQRRLFKISQGLPYVIDLMALGMSAGLDFVGAVREVVEKSSDPDDPLTFELRLILQELQLGKTRKEALREFGLRCPSVPVKEFVAAVIQAEERGNPVVQVLQIQATVSRTRRTVRGEELAAKAGVKMMGPVFMLCASILLLIGAPLFMNVMKGMQENVGRQPSTSSTNP